MQIVKEGNRGERGVQKKGGKKGGWRRREGKSDGNSGRFSADKWHQLQ